MNRTIFKETEIQIMTFVFPLQLKLNLKTDSFRQIKMSKFVTPVLDKEIFIFEKCCYF